MFDYWQGYFLNHLRFDEEDPYIPPVTLDWKVGLKQGIHLRSQLVDVKFLWGAKIFYLDHNPESEARELLETPIPVVVLKYDYGSFTGLDPEKQDALLHSYYRENEGDEPTLKYYKTLPNPFNKPGAREKAVVGRRISAIAYVKQRAKEIERLIEYVYQTEGEEAAQAQGLERIDLHKGIERFFSQFAVEMVKYRDAGLLEIVQRIQEVLNQGVVQEYNYWLKKQIPIDKTEDGYVLVRAGEIIQKILSDAVSPVTQADIDSAIVREFK